MVFLKKLVYMDAMDHQPRICLVHASGPICQALQDLGCETLLLMPELGGVFHLPTELERHGFTPDLVFQRERLGDRLLLSGLEEIPALRVFWALDPHLNAFWQAPYSRLFDLVFSTQRRWMPHLAACGAPRVRHLPWHAPEGPFVPFGLRPRLAGFVGRLGPTRPARTWLAELMGEALSQGFELRDNLDHAAMLDFYRDTRLVPNESITGEVNFRLFEAAGCGCVVLAQDLGPEQAELFEPGREMFVCADTLELRDTLSLLVSRPHLAEAVGRAAWKRAQADHLPLARARTLLHEANLATRLDISAPGARRWLALTRARFFEAGRLPGAGEAVLAELGALPGPDAPDPLVLDARLRTLHTLGRTAECGLLVQEALALLAPREADAGTSPWLDLSLSCSLRALGLGHGAAPDLPLARAFAAGAGVDLPDQESGPVPLLLAWAGRLDAAAHPERGGFAYDAARHLPASALECLHCATTLEPDNLQALRATGAHLARHPGTEVLRLGTLSNLTLRAREDWASSLALGLCSLQAFRHRSGLSEILLASQVARDHGQLEAFSQALALADSSGRIRRVLGPSLS